MSIYVAVTGDGVVWAKAFGRPLTPCKGTTTTDSEAAS